LEGIRIGIKLAVQPPIAGVEARGTACPARSGTATDKRLGLAQAVDLSIGVKPRLLQQIINRRAGAHLPQVKAQSGRVPRNQFRQRSLVAGLAPQD
jgi:hypothetical protein